MRSAMVDAQVDLNQFVFREVLTNCVNSKKIVVKGSFKENPESAVVILEREPFSSETIKEVLVPASNPQVHFKNDIYSSLRHFPSSKYTGVKTTVVYPATEEIVKKYTPETNRIVEESAKLYFEVTEPYITTKQHSIDWVYNILDHKSEVERIAYEDTDPETGFILLPDLKWDGLSLEGFYLQALPHIRGIKSLRDLNSSHLPLLRNIATLGPKFIEEKYKISKTQLLVYLHYLPSFYHIHVHFKLIQQERAAGTGMERAHLLSTVIQNIELCPDYYQKAKLPVSLKASDELFKKLEDNVTRCDNGNTAAAPIM